MSLKERKWDTRWLKIAKEVSSWSKDPSKQIGAIAVRDNRMLAQGYNGLPRGLPDTDQFLLGDIKYDIIIHAEENVIINAALNGVSLAGSTVYIVGLPPCSKCSGKLVNAGVVRIIYVNEHDDKKWKDSFELSKIILEHAGVVCDKF